MQARTIDKEDIVDKDQNEWITIDRAHDVEAQLLDKESGLLKQQFTVIFHSITYTLRSRFHYQ